MANNYGKKINSYQTAHFPKQTPARFQAFCRPSLTPSQRITGPIPYGVTQGKSPTRAAGEGLTDTNCGFDPHLLVPPSILKLQPTLYPQL